MDCKLSPRVTDSDFSVRVPSFLVANGWVMYINHSNLNTQRFLNLGDSIDTKRHGSFRVMYIGIDHGVLHHKTLTNKVMPLFVPPQKWLCVSNGAFKVENLNYPSWASQFPPASKEIISTKSSEITQDLLGKYRDLLDIFKKYWAKRFAENVQEDKDSHTFMLSARIRYGITCIMDGQIIPPDCGYQKLAKEIGSWISYREGDQTYHWE